MGGTAINTPAINKKLAEFGIEPVGNSPQEFAAMIKDQTDVWQKLIRDLKITLD